MDVRVRCGARLISKFKHIEAAPSTEQLFFILFFFLFFSFFLFSHSAPHFALDLFSTLFSIHSLVFSLYSIFAQKTSYSN